MIKGVDVGNFATKDELGNNFESKISLVPNVIDNKYTLEINNEVYYLGEGEFDTEYRKVNKRSYLKLLYGILSISSTKETNEIDLVLGLPITQYKNDKELLKNLINENYYMDGYLNGDRKKIIIRDCEVYLEGIAGLPKDYEGVGVDIGGRSTDSFFTYIENGKRKIENAMSLTTGTLNLYSDFINLINNKYSLDLCLKDCERIIRRGLTIDGKVIDLTNEKKIFKEYLEGLVSKLNVQYSLKTNKVSFIGGGSLILKNPIKKLITHSIISDSARFDNANGFYEYGRGIWE